MSRKPGASNYTRAANSTDEAEIKSLHTHCVSKGYMQLTYASSKDFELCDEDGTPNPIGMFYRSKRTAKIKPIRGQCSFEFLPGGERNQAWKGCPYGEDPNKMRVLPPPPPLEELEARFDGPVIVEAGNNELAESVRRLDMLLKGEK